MELEKVRSPTSISSRNYPNIDFTGHHVKAMGFPTSQFTAPLARAVGWVAQWNR